MHAGVVSNAYGVRGRVAIPRREFVLPFGDGACSHCSPKPPISCLQRSRGGQAMEAGETGKYWLELYSPIEDSKHASRSSPSNVFLAAICCNMVQVSCLIISDFPSSDVKHFQKFWGEAQSFFLDEYQCQCKHNSP